MPRYRNRTGPATFSTLPDVARFVRQKIAGKRQPLLLFAHNGTGKTRLSMAFKNLGRDGERRDTLYFNAFTEDLFVWENDLPGDADRHLKMNIDARFFAGLAAYDMEARIRPLLARYADFDFAFAALGPDLPQTKVVFSRKVNGEVIDSIKVSRGEENLFIWCFFLAVVELALEGDPIYAWVEYLYIDDPITSLDEQNAIAVANHLKTMLADPRHARAVNVVISTHHALFFNVLYNEFNKPPAYVFEAMPDRSGYCLTEQKNDAPFFHHVAALIEIHNAAQEDRLYTYHFNALRTVLEKTASFHGYASFGECIPTSSDDPDGKLRARVLNILSHGRYSLFEPSAMQRDNTRIFKRILAEFIERHGFNPKHFSVAVPPVGEQS